MTEEHIPCEQVIEHLFAFLDEELDDEITDRIEAHLQRCRDCFTRAEFEKHLRARVRNAAETRAPNTLHRRIRRIIDSF